jgi:hypothetical protein
MFDAFKDPVTLKPSDIVVKPEDETDREVLLAASAVPVPKANLVC